MTLVETNRLNNIWYSPYTGSVLKDQQAPWSNYQQQRSQYQRFNVVGAKTGQENFDKYNFQGWSLGTGLATQDNYIGAYLLHGQQSLDFLANDGSGSSREMIISEDRAWLNYGTGLNFFNVSFLAGANLGISSLITDINGPLQRNYQRFFGDLGLRTTAVGNNELFKNVWLGGSFLNLGQKDRLEPDTRAVFYAGLNSSDKKYQAVASFDHGLYRKDHWFDLGVSAQLLNYKYFNFKPEINYKHYWPAEASAEKYLSAVVNVGFKIPRTESNLRNYIEQKFTGKVDLYEAVLIKKEISSFRADIVVPMISRADKAEIRIYDANKKLIYTGLTQTSNYVEKTFSFTQEIPFFSGQENYFYNYVYLNKNNEIIKEKNALNKLNISNIDTANTKKDTFLEMSVRKAGTIDIAALGDNRQNIFRQRFFAYAGAEQETRIITPRAINQFKQKESLFKINELLIDELAGARNEIALNGIALNRYKDPFSEKQTLKKENEAFAANYFFNTMSINKPYYFLSGLVFEAEQTLNQKEGGLSAEGPAFNFNFYGGAKFLLNDTAAENREYIFGLYSSSDF